MNLNVSERLIWALRGLSERLSRLTDRVTGKKRKQLEESEERANMEMMEVDEPLSSSEAQRAPALDTEEGLSIPVAGPETPFRPTSGMPGLTPTGEHVTTLQFDEEQVLRGLFCVCDELQACCEHATGMLQML